MVNTTAPKSRIATAITSPINYTPFGRIDTVIDTLARSIKFNYDTNGLLTSITQMWNQDSPSELTHNWAVFTIWRHVHSNQFHWVDCVRSSKQLAHQSSFQGHAG